MDWLELFNLKNGIIVGLFSAVIAALVKIANLKRAFTSDDRIDSQSATKDYAALYQMVLARLETMEKKYEAMSEMYIKEKNANYILEDRLRTTNRKNEMLLSENLELRRAVGRKYRILAIEDDPADQKFLKVIFDKMPNFDLTILDSIAAAKALIKRNSIDCVLLDMNIGNDRFSIAKFEPFLEKYPFVVYTGAQYEESEMLKILQLGAVGYHSKLNVTTDLEMKKVIIDAMVWFRKRFQILKMDSQEMSKIKNDIQQEFKQLNAIIESAKG